MNRLVARYSDGHVAKGSTLDFQPGKAVFHMNPYGPDPGWDREEVRVDDLKALFFVKTFEGNPDHVEQKWFGGLPPGSERGVQVQFRDGETMLGTTPTYRSANEGFFITPADPESNNLRCYIPESSGAEIRYV